MQTILLARKTFVQTLSSLYPQTEIETFFWWCIEEYCGLNRSQTIGNLQLGISSEVQVKLTKALVALQNSTPIQYVLQKAWFCDWSFEVSPAVLIPRPETEELVMEVVKKMPAEGAQVFEVGTGSGCIAISLDKKLRQAKVTACDISASALEVAQRNAVALQSTVRFLELDILQWAACFRPAAPLHCVVSNPPYICESEHTAMKSNVLQHEPHNALFVPDADPLLFYRSIAQCAQQHLLDNGLLAVEINERFGLETAQLFASLGFKNIEVRKDFFGKDRMVLCNK